MLRLPTLINYMGPGIGGGWAGGWLGGPESDMEMMVYLGSLVTRKYFCSQ